MDETGYKIFWQAVVTFFSFFFWMFALATALWLVRKLMPRAEPYLFRPITVVLKDLLRRRRGQSRPVSGDVVSRD